MTTYAIVGAGGMLGRAFRYVGAHEGRKLLPLTRSQLDLVTSPSFDALSDADVVVNCSAYTDVDAAEQAEEEANAINGRGVGRLAEYCRKTGKKLVHFSTDYVFDGASDSPYRVEHPRAPLNAYGRSKALGENLIEQTEGDFLLIRTSWVYAPWGKNFVLTMARFLRERHELHVVSDQRGRPSSALELARNTFRLIDLKTAGIVHLSDAGECSWFEFTQEIQRQLGTKCAIRPCSSDEFPRPAKRPAYSVLELSRAEESLRELLPYSEALAEVLRVHRELAAEGRHG